VIVLEVEFDKLIGVARGFTVDDNRAVQDEDAATNSRLWSFMMVSSRC
jgi:hypothetical protein